MPLPRRETSAREGYHHEVPMRHFKVLHKRLDSWPEGHVLAESDLHKDADINRLLSIGAMQETDDGRTGDAPLGPETMVRDRMQPKKPAEAPATVSDGDTGDVSADLDALTVLQLKSRAKEAGVAHYSTLNKAELMEALGAKD